MIDGPIVICVLGDPYHLEIGKQAERIETFNDRRVINTGARLIEDRGFGVDNDDANPGTCELERRHESHRARSRYQYPLYRFHL